MDLKTKSDIYDRLLAISLKIDLQTTPNPGYINQKILECHSYIQEIERYNIQVSKEISVIQQALNNSLSEFESKKENYLTENEEIKILPNIKDREARANMLLREESSRVHQYQNELVDLNNLLKVTNLKIKNLNRANSDIKTQLRVLEAQLKLTPGGEMDKTVKGFMEEMDKGIETVGSKQTSDNLMDPSTPIDVDNLLSSQTEEEAQVDESLIEPFPNIEEDEEILPENEITDNIEEQKTIDLDQVPIQPATIKGGAPEQKVEITNNSPVGKPTNETDHSKADGFDLDALLDSIQLKS